MLRNNRDWLNVVRALLAPFVFFSPFWLGLPPGFELPAAIMIYLMTGYTNYILHLHIHHPFSNNRWINLVLDLAMGSVSGMIASNWRIQHLYGHHLGKDLQYRGRRDVNWELERYTPHRAISYCLQSMLPTLIEPFLEATRKGVLRNVKTPIRYRWAFVEHLLLAGLLTGFAVLDVSLVVTYVIPMYALTYFITRYVDYLNHYGCDETNSDVHLHANNCLNTAFNAWKHNFGYHTAHHLHPGAHWTRLPELHREIDPRIPERLKKRFSWSFLQLPYHFMLSVRDRM
ncbi:MAG: fatty acid desaturase [Pseudomonadota bacterium]